MIGKLIRTLFIVGVSEACRCIQPDAATLLKDAEVVFRGKVLRQYSLRSLDGRHPYEIEFEVLQIWKYPGGGRENKITINVGAGGGADCTQGPDKY